MKSLFSVPVQSLCAISLLVFVAGACAERNATPIAAAGNEDLVNYSLEIQADQSRLSVGEKNLLSQINSKQQVSFNSVTDLAQISFEAEYSEGKEANDELSRNIISGRERINSIVPLGLNELGAAEIKLRMEEGLRGYFAGDLEYDVAKSSILDPLLENVAQCYSGTLLYTQVARRIPGQTYRAKNFVTIFSHGHVLPGYAKSTGNGFELYGVETTQSGRAEKFYGNMDALPQGIVVVDADYFLLTEIFKGRIRNACEVQNKVIEITAAKYGISRPHGRCESGTALASRASARAGFSRGSLFAFGTPSTPPGRRPRAASGEGLENLAASHALVGNASAISDVGRRRVSAGERIYFLAHAASRIEKVRFIEGESLRRAQELLRDIAYNPECQARSNPTCSAKITELRELFVSNARDLDPSDCHYERNDQGAISALACDTYSASAYRQAITLEASYGWVPTGWQALQLLQVGRISEQAEGSNERRIPGGTTFLSFDERYPVGLGR